MILFHIGEVDSIGLKPLIEGGEADRKRCFCHAIASDKSVRVEADGLEMLGEVCEDIGADHIATDTGDAPTGEVELWGGWATGAEVIAERRGVG